MLEIKYYSELTNEFIMNIDDNLYLTTTAYKTFKNKQTFVDKIHDTRVRHVMLKNILQIV